MLTLNWIDCKTATLEGQLATIRMLSVSLKLPIQNFGVVSPPRSLPFLVSNIISSTSRVSFLADIFKD